MKTLTKSILIFLLVTGALVHPSTWLGAGWCTAAYADIPHLINYQGKLTDTSGKPVLDGAYSVTFRIYDAESAGTLLWEETQSVSVQKGIFSVMLGGATNLNLAFDAPYWLEIKVGTEVMSPRQRIASSGYAFSAGNGVPKRAVLMWSGKISDIPSGWALCDGTNGTPDLRDKFIVGARQDDGGIAKTNITNSLTQYGGSTTITAANLPAHSSVEGHSHQVNYGMTDVESGGGTGVVISMEDVTSSDGAHTHVHTGTGTPYTQPYYTLAYIMKV